MLLRLLAVSLLSSSALSPAQFTAETVTTAGMNNGRFWASMSFDLKVMYLVGVKDTLIATKPPDENAYLAGIYNVEEVEKSIDRFYETPENRLIPIVFALRVLS